LLKVLVAILGLVVLLPVTGPEPAGPERPSETEIRLEPREIAAGLFYDGASVQVDATVPLGRDVAVVCAGKGERLELEKKGKALGVLWMSVGDVAFESVPSVYQLITSKRLGDLAGRDVQERLGLGYGALEAKAIRDRGDEEQRRLFGELIKLKESEGLYSITEGTLELRARSSSARVSGRFRLPAKTPPGDYEVRLIGFKDGKAERLGCEPLRLRQVGMTAFISSLARQHGFIYGVFAVLIALGVGLLTGLLFGLGSKRGH
jgi:uncharacterized protein (TIGR02186 family)